MDGWTEVDPDGRTFGRARLDVPVSSCHSHCTTPLGSFLATSRLHTHMYRTHIPARAPANGGEPPDNHIRILICHWAVRGACTRTSFVRTSRYSMRDPPPPCEPRGPATMASDMAAASPRRTRQPMACHDAARGISSVPKSRGRRFGANIRTRRGLVRAACRALFPFISLNSRAHLLCTARWNLPSGGRAPLDA